MYRRILAASLIAAMLSFPVWAQEHPEHPKKADAKKAEHPEHPEHPKESAAAALTVEQLAHAIEEFIEDDMDLKGGWFLVYDPVDKQVLQLTLSKIHTDKLAHLGNEVYFACTDMRAANDVVYDLDFFMERQADGGLAAHEISVHKKSGKPRYGWKEEKGIWTKVKP